MECRAHNVYTGEQRVVLRTHIKFVRIDEDGNPIPISDRAKNRINKLILGEPVVGDTVI
jgi:acyl-CoA hydrolase